jgi:hypothetical protein
MKNIQVAGNEKTLSVDVNNWPAGLYLLQAAGQQGMITKTFVVEK